MTRSESITHLAAALAKAQAEMPVAVFDTLELLSFGRSFEGNGVDDVARVFGLPPKLGHGGDFPMLWRADREAAIAYNRRDVEIEVEIARICGCI